MKPYNYMIILIQWMISVIAFNTHTNSFDELKGPRENSYFGYSITAAERNGSLTIWTGSPKFTLARDSKKTGRPGAVYSCNLGTPEAKCHRISFKSEFKNGAEFADDSFLPDTALSPCPFTNSTCRFTTDSDVWLTGETFGKYKKFQMLNSYKKVCFRNATWATHQKRLTGPPSYTYHGGFVLVKTAENTKIPYVDGNAVMRLTSPRIQSTKGVTQCLRFCYNAYSILDNEIFWSSKRMLQVFMVYENSTDRNLIFSYKGPSEMADKLWNFTEKDIPNKKNGFYKLVFEVTLIENDGYRAKCPPTTDIAINDISVSNIACEDESDSIDILEDEQSMGMSVKLKVSETDSSNIITACAPLRQKNCGYAKEATGVCYEIKMNSSGSRETIKHDPVSKGCIKGKIDVVLLVDQSGSVNQCNFQKVKRWLRNIVRGFTLGPEEQDIAIVVYSSEAHTRNVFDLGFEEHENNGESKKKRMLKGLKMLPYDGGTTYTGLAFKHANDILWGENGRSDARKMIILLTDGATTRKDRPNLREQVKIARERNTTTLAVGVAGFDEKELITISGSKRNFFPVSDFSQLEQVRDKLRESVSYSNLEGSQVHGSSSDSMQNCQLGFSLHYSKYSLLMGSPGCYSRAGDVIGYQQNGREELDERNRTTSSSDLIDATGGNFSGTTVEMTEDALQSKNISQVAPSQDTAHLTNYVIPDLDELERVMKDHMDDAYFGYAVTSGYYHGFAGGEFIGSSAPRFNGVGAVLVYKSQDNLIIDDQVIHGLQLGEYFGASLGTDDINMDGFDDLFVSAPLHSADNPDEGRVYVYMGNSRTILELSATLKGSGSSLSRFGISIAAVGDLTLDGYRDLVISSPQEDNGGGAIYIFHGGKTGIHTSYVQRISSSDLREEYNHSLFGQSIVGGLDVDKNGYPDLLVGAPGSDAIVVLRTRPVIRINSDLKVITPPIDRRDLACWQQNRSFRFANACFTCSACFSFYGISVPSEIVLRYAIKADINKTTSRAGFHENNKVIIHNEVTLKQAEVPWCFNHTLYLKKHIQDVMTKISLLMQFELLDPNQAKQSMENERSLAPLLDIHTVKQHIASSTFKTYCIDTSSCVADIYIQSSHPVDGNGFKLDRYQIDERRIIRFMVAIANLGPEDAHSVVVTVWYHSGVIFNSMKNTTCFKVLESMDQRKRDYSKLEMGLKSTLLKKGEKCKGILHFMASGDIQPDRQDHLRFKIDSKTVSKDENLKNNGKTIDVPLIYDASFTIRGSSFPATISNIAYNTTESTDDSKISFQHDYTIINDGLVELHNMRISIEWPSCVELHGVYYPVNFAGYSECAGRQHSCRLLGNVTDVLAEACSLDEGSGGEYQQCSTDPHSFCTLVNRSIGFIKAHSSVSVTIHGVIASSTLWNLTDAVTLTSTISLELDGDSIFEFPTDQQRQQSASITIYPTQKVEQVPDVEQLFVLPIWVYIVSILAGILLLLTLVVVLYLCGFFKSKYADKKKNAQEDLLYSSERVPMNVET